ncbi:hypothetical protein AQUCO_04700021v1 [Aquilegia coerulea]|uniref:Uncharacterized protein n=1 Tax=Aquilegia coerulea TaxID=218851 RepID=A0A2G5CKT6_AQUCA|nr:hypothetical protein AQUCO_04700021v1 [Aquilegia coerulea]
MCTPHYPKPTEHPRLPLRCTWVRRKVLLTYSVLKIHFLYTKKEIRVHIKLISNHKYRKKNICNNITKMILLTLCG